MIKLRKEILSRMRRDARFDEDRGLEMLLHFYDEAHKQNDQLKSWFDNHELTLDRQAREELDRILGYPNVQTNRSAS